MGSLALVRAESTDLDAVLTLLDEAATWLRGQGVYQWPKRFSGVGGWRSERIAAYIEAGETYLLWEAGEPIATVTFNDKADPDYAHGWPGGPDAGCYIYRMAVRRAHAGRNLGKRIIDWADDQTVESGRQWLRLDVHRQNKKLQRYYESCGFIRVATLVAVIDPGGERQPSGEKYERGSGALYQRPVGIYNVTGTA